MCVRVCVCVVYGMCFHSFAIVQNKIDLKDSHMMIYQ